MKDRIDAIIRREQAEYLDRLMQPRDALLARMEQIAEEDGQPIADPEVAQLLRVLIAARRPVRILEIGTNIGYSVIVMGRAAGAGAVIETIELDDRILAQARGFVEEARLEARVVFHHGAALEVLPELQGAFDFVFIDCVKEEYVEYLDALMPKLEPGAVIACDNVLWKGQVATQPRNEGQVASTEALRRFNERLTTDTRLLTSILPLGDGVSVSIVR